jgi:type IV secretion system protein VirB10
MTKAANEDLLKKEFPDDPQANDAAGSPGMDAATNEPGAGGKEAELGKLEEPKTQKLSPNNLTVVIGAGAIVMIGLAYFLISSSDNKKDDADSRFGDSKPTTSKALPTPSLYISSGPPDAFGAAPTPKEPEPPKALAPAVQPAPPAPPPLLPISAPPAPPTAAPAAQNTTVNRYDAKVKSSMLLKGGGASAGEVGADSKDKLKNPLTESTADGDFTPGLSKVATSQLTRIGDMTTVIAQGKMMDSVLETPVNTLHPGPIRAIISRDVYSESGSNILVPKGSRLIGTLKGGYSPGITRIAISWDRVILPSGYDIAMTAAPGTDKLGMIGIEGIVNRQFIETVGSAALLSIINIGAARVVEDYFHIKPAITTSTTNPDGTRIRQDAVLTPTQQAAQAEFQNLSNLTKNWLSQNFLPTPYIVVNQGTRLKVFVNQDIRFPKNLNGTTNIIR